MGATSGLDEARPTARPLHLVAISMPPVAPGVIGPQQVHRAATTGKTVPGIDDVERRRMRAIRTSLAIAVLVAACQPVPPPKRSVHEPARVPTPLIHGRAFFLERMLLAPGATLEVLLIAEQSDAGVPATVTLAHFDDLHGPPYDFDLPYDPAKIDAAAHYSLRAHLRDANGHLEFTTDARVPVTPGAAQRTEFRLVRAGAG